MVIRTKCLAGFRGYNYLPDINLQSIKLSMKAKKTVAASSADEDEATEIKIKSRFRF